MSSDDGKDTAAKALADLLGEDEVEGMNVYNMLYTYTSFYVRNCDNDDDTCDNINGISANDDDPCANLLNKFMGGYDPRSMSSNYKNLLNNGWTSTNGKYTISGGYIASNYVPIVKYDISSKTFSTSPGKYEDLFELLSDNCECDYDGNTIDDHLNKYFKEGNDENQSASIIATLFSIYIFNKYETFKNAYDEGSTGCELKKLFTDMMEYYVEKYIKYKLCTKYEDDEDMKRLFSENNIIFTTGKNEFENKIMVGSTLADIVDYFYECREGSEIKINEGHKTCINKFGRYISGCSFINEHDMNEYNEMLKEYDDYRDQIWEILIEKDAVNICENIIDGEIVANDTSNITINQTMECVQMIDGHDNDGDSDDNLRPDNNNKPIPTNEDTDGDEKDKEEDKEEDNGTKTLMVVIIILAVIIIMGMIGLMIYLGVSNSKSEEYYDESESDDYSSE